MATNELRKDISLFENRNNLISSGSQILIFLSWFKSSGETATRLEIPLNNTATLTDLIYQSKNNNDQINDKNDLMLPDPETCYEEKTDESIP